MILAAIGGLGLGGCGRHWSFGHLPPATGPASIGESAAVLESSVIKPGSTVRSEQEQILRVQSENRRFSVMFGPPDPSTVPAGQVAQGQAKYMSVGTGDTPGSGGGPAVSIHLGYGIFWGWMPYPRTPRLSTVVEGATVVVQSEPNSERVYFAGLDSSGDPSPQVTVYLFNLNSDGNPTGTPVDNKVMTSKGCVEATRNAAGVWTLQAPRALFADEEDFLRELRAKASATIGP